MKKNNQIYWEWEKRLAPVEEALECIGKGWRSLVEALIIDLFNLGWNGHLTQVKEKFGGLIFYAEDCTEAMYDLIQKAEDKSKTVCEACGKPGKLREGSWLKTLCDEHAAI